MIVYGEDSFETDPVRGLRDCAAALERLGKVPDHDLLRGELIRLGEIEAGLGDALCARLDRIEPRLTRLRRLSIDLGRLLWRSWSDRRGADDRGSISALAKAVAQIAEEDWPARIRVRPPEGYAHYAVYPESYGEAAARLARSRGLSRAAVVGIRSIGTSLSAVAAGVLEESGIAVESWCVRPRGHPFSRSLPIDAELRSAWARAAGLGAVAVIIDEGPGLSGSSLLSVLRALRASGFAEARIVLMPHWDPPAPPMADCEAISLWRRARKVPADFDDLWRRRMGFSSAEDLSGGRWREQLPPGAPRPTAQPQHERRKFLTQDEDGSRRLWKFAGLGAHGAPRRARAEALAGSGFAPEVLGLRSGFLVQRYAAGRLLSRPDLDRRLVDRAVAYVAFRAKAFPTGRPARLRELSEMIAANLSEGLGPEWRVRSERILGDTAVLETSTVAVDGRMMPHEWLLSDGTLLKTDGVDHADDHFFPRDQDIAWDIAGFCAEFRANPQHQSEVADAVARAVKDRHLPRRMPFYAIAYRAYQLGYAQLAAIALGRGPDSRGFQRRARRFREELKRLLGDRSG
jgi:hypothetical protein